MTSEEDPTVYGEDDLEEDDDDESEEEDLILPPASNPRREDLEDEDVGDEEDDDTSSSNLATSAGKITVSIASVRNIDPANPIHAGRVAVTDFLPDPKRHRIEDVTIAAAAVEEKKPLAALDESRRLFQRLWTDEDEIELLQGFLDYTTQRGGNNNSSHHHDTTAFYDQIKCKLQLDFNKNQLVEKLRRLKKKYRNVLNKIVTGKQYAFKSPHDKSTFEISNKIWSVSAVNGGAGGAEEAGLDDDDPNPNPNPTPTPTPTPTPNLNLNLNSIDLNNNGIQPNSSEKKGSRSRKRSRVKIEEKHQSNQQPHQTATPIPTPTPMATSIPNLIEETVRSCVSPLFKELLHNSTFSRGFGGIAALNTLPFALNFTGGDMIDEKWRKQQILELEVYSKRLELVQDQIKSSLEELRPMGS